MFADVKQARWQTLLAFVLAHGAFKLLFFSGALLPFADRVYGTTRGLVTPVFLAYLAELVLLVGVVLWGVERLRARDLGLGRTSFLNGVIVLLHLWGLKQVCVWIGLSLTSGASASAFVAQVGEPALWGKVTEVWLGNAFFEEVMYRGFLLPQLYLLARRWWPEGEGRPLAFSVGATQLYFGLNHLPVGLANELDAVHLAAYITQATLMGVLLAFIFLRTGNLYVAISVHALVNFPVPLFEAPIDPALLVLAQSCLLLACWPYLYRRYGDVFTMRPALAVAAVRT